MRFRSSGSFAGRLPGSPVWYYITDRRQLPSVSLLGQIRACARAGVDFIQIREKDLPDRTLFDLACRAVSAARGTRCRILVNVRADIALAAGAAGVHLPASGLRPSDIRPWVPGGFVIGSSVHSLREARRACAQGADYLLLGHVFATGSKEGLGPPLGLACLRRVSSGVPAPVLALGGMRPGTIDSVLASGARGVAGITLFQDREMFRRLRRDRHWQRHGSQARLQKLHSASGCCESR